MINLILDSSVIAKWFFPNEEESDIALKIKEDFVNKKITISAPTLLFYEVNNILKTAVKSLRIKKEKAIRAYRGFLDLGIIVYSSEELLENTLDKAMNLDLSSYDASYIILADYLKAPFFTADKKLLSKVKSKFTFNLEEYPISKNGF